VLLWAAQQAESLLAEYQGQHLVLGGQCLCRVLLGRHEAVQGGLHLQHVVSLHLTYLCSQLLCFQICYVVTSTMAPIV
jgi:hypothetical protein